MKMIGREEVAINIDLFGNKEVLNEGRISRFGTVSIQTINPYGIEDPQQLYSDLLLDFRGKMFHVALGRYALFVIRSSLGNYIRSISADQIHFVRDISVRRVTAGGWLAKIDGQGRMKAFERRDLPLVRKAVKGTKPPACSERGFLRVDQKYRRRLMVVLAMGHEPLPLYRVFDPRGNLVSFWLEYPLSYSQWKAGEERSLS
jgi:hypothetical protein